MTSHRLLSDSTIRGMTVVNPQGEKLGEIKELMLDLDTGTIAYAVLSFGGFLGMGDKLFTIPFESLRMDAEREHVVLNVAKERLKEAPALSEGQWSQRTDPTYLDRVYTHYGYEPYERYREARYGGYYERQRRMRDGTTLDVVDPKHDGIS